LLRLAPASFNARIDVDEQPHNSLVFQHVALPASAAGLAFVPVNLWLNHWQ
jgi:hypothetical protein